MMKIVKADGNAELELIRSMRARAEEVGTEVDAVAAEIMAQVRKRGYEAVREYSLKFDKAEPYEINRETLNEAYKRCDGKLIAAMERSAQNIRDYQSRLLKASSEWSVGKAGKLGQIVRGLTRVGVYVPGGTAAYPSTVLMNAVTARVAGVQEIIMVTPPTQFLSDAVLAAARIAGVDRVIAVGGVQAVAALTYGAGFIPQVDKLVGPGNAYVTAAKRMAYGRIDIDSVAGPSEVLIIADETANPVYTAADLLSQAEHDMLASAVLVTTSEDLVQRIAAELERQLTALSRKEIARKSLEDFGAIILCGSLDRAAELANILAPEHLEILTDNPRALLPKIFNAGAVFLGPYSPEPLGDYMAGPNHVLPTSGTARFFSPLSVDSFIKSMSLVEYTRQGLSEVYSDIDIFANAEGLTAHAASVNVRFQDEL